MFIFTKSLPFYLWIMFLIPGGALQNLTKSKPTSLGFIQPRISQVLRVHKDLLLDLFSSSAVQMENQSGQFVPNRASIVWTRPNSLTGIAPYVAWTWKSRKPKWGSVTRKYSPVRLLHFCIQVMGSRRPSQTPELLCETVWQVDENLEKLF